MTKKEKKRKKKPADWPNSNLKSCLPPSITHTENTLPVTFHKRGFSPQAKQQIKFQNFVIMINLLHSKDADIEVSEQNLLLLPYLYSVKCSFIKSGVINFEYFNISELVLALN